MNLRDTETVGLVKAASKRKRKTKRAPERRGSDRREVSRTILVPDVPKDRRGLERRK